MQSVLTELSSLPLHPLVVHFPVVFAAVAPIVAIAALFAIRRGSRPLVAWGITVALLAALSSSAWFAHETGEEQEEKVENVVPDAALETHEESADRFQWLSVALLVVAAAGLLNGRAGAAARLLATVGTIAMVAAAVQVGHSGGALVYKHNAGSAYSAAADTASARAPTPEDDKN